MRTAEPIVSSPTVRSHPAVVEGGGITNRQFAILRAIAGGRAEIDAASHVELLIDGVACCDQFAAMDLIERGLVGGLPAGTVRRARWRATLTPAGSALIADGARSA